MAEAVKLNWEFSERQKLAHKHDAQFLLYGGAKGGGKSFWLTRWCFKKLFEFKGNKGYIGRKRSVDFNNTTLETWKKAIDPRLYRINEQKKKIYVPLCDGVMDFGGMDSQDDIRKFNSAEYGFLAIDQAEEISRDDFSMLRGTLRHKLPDGSEPDYQVRLTANPAQCWLKDDFISMPKEGYAFIKALPSDNPFLATEYIKNLEEAFCHRPELLAAYLHGSWEDLAGHDLVCQNSWVEAAKKVVPRGNVVKRAIFCDPARFGDDETVIYTMEESSAAYVVDREILTHKSLMDTAGRLAAKRKSTGATLIGVDGIGIGAGVVDALNDLSEPVLDVVSSKRPTSDMMAEKYLNLRAQIWFEGAKKIFEGKAKVEDDQVLAGQLTCVKYEFKGNGKLKVESKEEIKKRLDSSPDRADAFLGALFTLDMSDRLDRPVDNFGQDRQGQGVAINNRPDLEYSANEHYEPLGEAA